MRNMPSSFVRFSTLADAAAFGKEHGWRVTSDADPDGSAHDAAFAADLLRLQASCLAGTHRVTVETDEDWGDLSWDETGETARKLASGDYVCVGVTLFEADEEGEWGSVDSVWNIIGDDEWTARQAQVYAASFLPKP